MAGNPSSKRLLDGIGGTLHRIVFIFPEGGHLRQVGAGNEESFIVVGREGYEVHEQPLLKRLIEPEILFDLADETSAQLLIAAVHRQLRPAIATNHSEVATPTLVIFEGTALPRQPPTEFA